MMMVVVMMLGRSCVFQKVWGPREVVGRSGELGKAARIINKGKVIGELRVSKPKAARESRD